jgi:hypothetical protein
MTLAIAHYRQGNIEDAIFWYNAGRLRAMYDAVRCTDISARSAVPALLQGMPRELIQAQFDDLVRLRQIIDRVVKWDEITPQNYEYRWINLHGMAAMKSSLTNNTHRGDPLTVPRESWDALAKQTREEFRSSIEKTIGHYQNQKQQ